jgi:transcription initiation factor IIE alpha subunit
MYIAKVIDRDNDEGVKFWRFNHDYRKEGIFDKIHGVLNSVKKNKDILTQKLVVI